MNSFRGQPLDLKTDAEREADFKACAAHTVVAVQFSAKPSLGTWRRSACGAYFYTLAEES